MRYIDKHLLLSNDKSMIAYVLSGLIEYAESLDNESELIRQYDFPKNFIITHCETVRS